MPGIHFHSSRIKFKPKNQTKLAGWLTKSASRYKRSISQLDYVFCSDAYLYHLNVEYLGHKTLTDIISFDYADGDLIEGEIYISIPRVRENASLFEVPFDSEFRRVLVHGLLHFMGFNDKTKGQKAIMRREEEACLSLWK